jgi:hypothetical protein
VPRQPRRPSCVADLRVPWMMGAAYSCAMDDGRRGIACEDDGKEGHRWVRRE